MLCAPSPVSAQVFYLENFSGYCEARLVLGTLVTEPSLWSLSLCQACREWHPEVGYDPTYRGDNDVYLCPRLDLAYRPLVVPFRHLLCFARQLARCWAGGRRVRALVWTSCWPDRVVLVDVDLRHALCHRRLTDEMDEADDLESVLTSADALVKRTQKRNRKDEKERKKHLRNSCAAIAPSWFLAPKVLQGRNRGVAQLR